MKIKILFFILIAFLSFSSCLEDEGNYDLADLNNATITSFSYGSAIVGEPYEIKPEIDFKGFTEDDFEYFWYANLSDYTTSDTLSYEKNLKFVFKKPGWYVAVFLVKNKQTGGITTRMFDFNVYSQYQRGWLVLADKSGESTLSYIRVNSANTIDKTVNDIYGTIYSPDKLGTTPLSLAMHYSDAADQILVVQDGGTGTIELSGTNFGKVITTSEEFVDGAYPSGFTPLLAEYGERIEVVVGKDGRTYSRIRTGHNFQTSRYSTTPINNAKITQTLFRPSLAYIFLYDEQNKRIMGIQDVPQAFTGKILYAKMDPDGNNEADFTDLANMGTDSKVIYTGSYSSGSIVYYVQILKKGDKYRIQKYRLRLETAIQTLYVVEGTESDFLGNGLVTDQTQYYLNGGLYLFFGQGNSLYYYDFNLNQIKTYTTLSGNITVLESNPNKDQIGVGLDNGEFYVFDVANEVLASGLPKQIFKTENLGKIVDVKFKYGNYNNFFTQI